MSPSKPCSPRSSFEDGPAKALHATNRSQTPALSFSQQWAGNPQRRISTPTHAVPIETSQPMPNSLPPRSSAFAETLPPGSSQTPFVMPTSTVPTTPQYSSLNFSQALSGISKPSPSFIAAHGEFHASGNVMAGNGNPSCVGQVDGLDGTRGPKNPYALSLDKSMGYLPQGSEVVPGAVGQTNMTQLNDRPSLEDLLRTIAAERLHKMPQKGSNWDRSIRTLENLALKVSGFASQYDSAVDNVQLTATMIYGRCYVLLQLGRNQATSLVPALGMLARISRTLSLFAGYSERSMSTQLQQLLGQILDRTLDLLNGIASYFQDVPVGLDTSTGPIGFRRSLSQTLEAFDLQADQLLSEIWTCHIPSENQEPRLKLTDIQQLLQPQDEVVHTTHEILIAEKTSRHEYTCEWFSKPFLDFVRSSDSAFWVDGRIGCGKSVLCGWVLESLQSPVDGQEYAVITYAIDPLIPSEASTACVIKALLRQIIKRQSGSGDMHRALVNLMGAMMAGVVQVENALWECLQIAIDDAVQPMMLVIDGLSELDGGEAAAVALFQNLLDVIGRNRLIRLLVLSRPFALSPKSPLRRKTIEARDVHKDLHRVVTDSVPIHSATPSVEVARRIDQEANGNYLWSLLTLQEWGAQDFSLQMWRTLPTSLDTTVAHLLSKIDLADQLTRLVLFSSLIATRPLRLLEMQIISRIDVTNNMLSPQIPDIAKTIEQACGSVLVVQEGMVIFRHDLFKQAFVNTLRIGTLSLTPEMHADMATRLLLYLKLVLTQHSELTLKPTSSSAMQDLFNRHTLLPYALRYWTSHIVSSAMYTEFESFNPNGDFKLVFPETVSAAIIEASFWTRKLSWESFLALNVAAQVRREILGNHEATLQTVASLAEALKCAHDYTGATTNFAVASELAQQVLPEFHTFTATCMSRFLDVVDLADHSTISGTPSQKSQVLRYMTRMYGTQFGPSSDQAIEFHDLLASHYTTIGEDASAADTFQTIHRLTLDRHGRDSSQAKATGKRLVTALQESCPSTNGSQQYSDAVYDDILQTYDATDTRRIQASIAKAETYTSRKEPFKAEILYISLWHGIAEACHRQKTLKKHEKLLEVGVLYARFLCQYGRMSEAQTVLLGLWSQQQASGYESGSITALLKDVAMGMKQSGLRDMALDVLNTILAGSEKQESDSIEKIISDITLDLMRDAQGSSILPKSSEAALLGILDANKSNGGSATNASVANALATSFANAGRFEEIIAVASETLRLRWPSILEISHHYPNHSTPEPFDAELAKLAASLAQAHTTTNQSDKVGHIYQHLYRAAKDSEAVDDSVIIEYAGLALTAFEQTGEDDQIIGLRCDLVHYCMSKYGEAHPTTIEYRYALASIYLREQRFQDAKQQYSRIATTLQQPTFHESAALPALRKLIELCHREKSWDQALEAYGSLWKSFQVKGLDFGFDPSTARDLYDDYTTVLKRQDPVDASALHETVKQYRSACLEMYGERDPSTIEATLLLGESWNSRHPGSTEAIRLYEWLVDGQDESEETKAFFEKAEDNLIDAYRAGINGDGQTTTRAVHLQGKRYRREKTLHGPADPGSLSSLGVWISMLTKQGDSRALAIQELRLAVDTIIGSDLQPSSLYNAAVVLATSFTHNDFVEEGLDTVKRLTEQVIFEQDGIYDTDQQARRSNLVFLTAFEAHLTTVDFAEIHAKILMESALWESYKRLSLSDEEPAMALACGARLRNFLVEHNSADISAMIEHCLYDRFIAAYGSAFPQGDERIQSFFLILVSELGSGERLEIDIPRLACVAINKRVSSLLDGGQFLEALNLSTSGFEFVRFVGAFTDKSNLASGFRLALMLACSNVAPAPHQALGAQMSDLSKTILQETLGLCRSQNVDFTKFDIDLISSVASVLGLQQNYEDLEWLLSRLWLSRKSLTSLSQDVIIQLGRRLVEVKFFHGHVDSAIELGEDILYNLQRVYGTGHPSTVDMATFLSSMYVASGDSAAAMAVMGDASQLKLPNTKGPTASVNTPQAADTVKSNLESLLQFYQRNGDSNKPPSQSAAVARKLSEELGISDTPGVIAPTVQQRPASWGFVDRSGEKRFVGMDHKG